MGQNLSRKTATAKCIFLSYLNSSKNSEKLRHIEDEKLQLQLKSQLIRSYIIKMKNQTVHRLRAGIKSPNRNSNFIKPKWVKLGTLLKIPETKLRKQSLVTARGHKENPNKNNRFASRKALSL